MKKWMLLTMMLGATALQAVAQVDDMYFVPSKKNLDAERGNYGSASGTYYSGSSRSVDDYNRRGSYYEVLPADTGDIITFSSIEGVYPDSVGDFQLTQQMARWDGYEPSAAYWTGYTRGLRDSSWGWHSPWYYSSYYPWYDSYWYDPWYWDSWHLGWYDPWYSWRWGWGGYYSSYYYRPWHYYSYGYGGWGGYGSGRHYYSTSSGTGTIDRYGRTSGGFNGNRGTVSTTRLGRASTRTVSGHNIYTGGRSTSGVNSGSGNFTGSRSTGNTGTFSSGSRSTGSSGGGFSSGGGNFGGSRSGGGGGGGRSGGSRR